MPPVPLPAKASLPLGGAPADNTSTLKECRHLTRNGVIGIFDTAGVPLLYGLEPGLRLTYKRVQPGMVATRTVTRILGQRDGCLWGVDDGAAFASPFTGGVDRVSFQVAYDPERIDEPLRREPDHTW